ncbi:MAG: hypothetical protein V2I82_17025 [Halieaceae bacterium]|nr:hypothetical protein [Halieaceae bacterium]
MTIFAAAALITLAAGASFLAPPEVDYGREAWNALQRATERSVAVVEEWTESLRAFLRRAAESDAVTPGNIAAMHQTIEPDEVEALRAENERLQERLSRIEAAIALSTAGAATATPKAPEPTTAADRASNND